MQARREYLGRGFRCIKACTVKLNSEWLTILAARFSGGDLRLFKKKKKKRSHGFIFSDAVCSYHLLSAGT